MKYTLFPLIEPEQSTANNVFIFSGSVKSFGLSLNPVHLSLQLICISIFLGLKSLPSLQLSLVWCFSGAPNQDTIFCIYLGVPLVPISKKNLV